MVNGDENHLEPAISYGRESYDRYNDEHTVDAQLAGNRDAAPHLGLRIVTERRDDDISAHDGTHRPGYQQVVDDIRGGVARVVLVLHTSRLWRDRVERSKDINLFGTYGVRIVARRGPHLDLSTAAGRGLAGLMGEFDTMESETKGERVRDELALRAAAGRSIGPVAYGWRRENVFDDRGRRVDFNDVEHPEQADVVRWIVDQLLAGKSIKWVVASLNDRGIVAPGGGLWLPSGVRKVALRPANIARKVYKSADIGRAVWPAIVDEDKHHRVVALLNDPVRLTSRSGARQHALTYNADVGRCGVCEGPLAVHTVKTGRRRTAHVLYACQKGCVGRNQEKVDLMVEGMVIGVLARPDWRRRFDRKDTRAVAARTRAEALRARLLQATDDYDEDRITHEQFLRQTTRLRDRIAEQEEIARRAQPGVGPELAEGLTDGPVEDRVRRWRALSAGQKQRLLAALRVQVRILPVRRKGAGFDPTSVLIVELDDA